MIVTGCSVLPASFNGAALRRARRCEEAGEGRSNHVSFNGAALRRARRFGNVTHDVMHGEASTGPRSGERGDTEKRLITSIKIPLQRGRAPESAEMTWEGSADA